MGFIIVFRRVRSIALGLLFACHLNIAPAQSIATLERQAQAGHAGSQLNLGLAYYYGRGVEQDLTRALPWLRAAGDQGDVNALIMLAHLVEQGDLAGGTDMRDRLVEQAARLGSTSMQRALARMRRLATEPQQAVYWLRFAAEQGDVDAMAELAHTLLHDMGRNSSGLQWLTRAALNNHADAQQTLGEIWEQGSKGLQRNLNQAQFWYLESLRNGDENAVLHALSLHQARGSDSLYAIKKLAQLKGNGPDGNANLAALRLFVDPNQHTHLSDVNDAAEQGSGLAYYGLYAFHTYYADMPDPTLASSMLERAVALGHDASTIALARHAYHGDHDGIAQDFDRAVALLVDLAQSNTYGADAQYLLSRIYHRGINGTQDLDQALSLLERSAGQGHNDALVRLAHLLSCGQDVAQDLDRAIQLYETLLSTWPQEGANNYAWLLATCTKAPYRDGQRAVRIMRDNFGDRPNRYTTSDTLAAAWAEAGEFEQAVALQQHAIELLPASQRERNLGPMQQRLQAYQEGQPWRDACSPSS